MQLRDDLGQCHNDDRGIGKRKRDGQPQREVLPPSTRKLSCRRVRGSGAADRRVIGRKTWLVGHDRATIGGCKLEVGKIKRDNSSIRVAGQTRTS